MASLNYDSLIPYIALDVAGAPYPLIVAMINMAAREFCLQSSCWNEYEDIPLAADKSDYEPSTPNGAQVRFVKSILINNREILPASEDKVLYYMRSAFSAVGSPLYYYMLNDMAFRVLPKPTLMDAGQIMRVRTVFVPKFNATVFDANLIERYAETLIAGAKARLMEMPGKPWSNPGLAGYNKGLFDVGVAKARIDFELSNVPSEMKVRQRNFRSV